MTQPFLFVFVGLFLGTLGTLIGAGGGFLLVPLLLILFPTITPIEVTAISLFAVACNAISGSAIYALHERIHWPSALLFAAVGLPGAWIGPKLAQAVSRDLFSLLFTLMLLILGLHLIFNKSQNHPTISSKHFVLSRGKLILGAIVSFVTGVLASFLGIGGGIIHVPFLSQVLKYPVHLATGTSQFILAITAIAATLGNWNSGHLNFAHGIEIPIAFGVVLGAQVGAQLARRMSGTLILRILGFALIAVALRLGHSALTS